MEAAEAIGVLASQRVVERLVLNITHTSTLSADHRDLCQMVYLFLLEYDADKVLEAYTDGWINLLIVNILKKMMAAHGDWNRTILRFKHLATEEITESIKNNGE